MSNQSVLIVDDEPDIRELLDITLSRMGLETFCAEDLGSARQLIAKHQPNLCLTDMKLPDGNGISLVEDICRDFPNIPVAMITAHGSVETAISALKAGAFDFISKPIELDTLRALVATALAMDGDSSKVDEAVDNDLVGSAPAIVNLRAQISKLARSQAPVHIHGESGAGKEVVARLIHNNGPRTAGSFVAVNCGASPPELVESELFGHIKGSFTGATADKLGLFQAAAGGTLFLDEVADLPLAMQVKLLRAIQEKAVRPVGAQEEQLIDVRILSATHKNLANEVAAGNFRNDLYYRINVIEVQVPALRERASDIPSLAQTLLARICEQQQFQVSLDEDAIEALKAYAFPGNVRELENTLERAIAMCDGNRILAADLQFSNSASPVISATPASAPTTPEAGAASPTGANAFSPQEAYGDMEGYLEDIERQIISRALEDSRWNKTNTAKLLGISFRSLRYRLKKLGLEN